MSMYFLRLTRPGGSPVYIRAEHITDVWADLRGGTGITITSAANEEDYWTVMESVEDVMAALARAGHPVCSDAGGDD